MNLGYNQGVKTS